MTANRLRVWSPNVRSLERRWIFPGQLDTVVAGWFARLFGTGWNHARISAAGDPSVAVLAGQRDEIGRVSLAAGS